MKASEHLALCEGKRGGATAEERVLCAELEAAEARCKRLASALRALRDEQEGAPLIRRKDKWQAAVDESDRLLAEEEARG